MLLTANSLPPTPCLHFFSLLHSHHMVHAGRPWCSRRSSRQWTNRSQRLTSSMPSSMLQSGTCSSFARYGLSSFRVVGYRRASAILKVHTVAFTAQDTSITYADSLRSAIPFCSKRQKEQRKACAFWHYTNCYPFCSSCAFSKARRHRKPALKQLQWSFPLSTMAVVSGLCVRTSLAWAGTLFKQKYYLGKKKGGEKKKKKKLFEGTTIQAFYELQPAFL